MRNNFITSNLWYLHGVEKAWELGHAEWNGFVVSAANYHGAWAVVFSEWLRLRFDSLLVQQQPEVQKETDQHEPPWWLLKLKHEKLYSSDQKLTMNHPKNWRNKISWESNVVCLFLLCLLKYIWLCFHVSFAKRTCDGQMQSKSELNWTFDLIQNQ